MSFDSDIDVNPKCSQFLDEAHVATPIFIRLLPSLSPRSSCRLLHSGCFMVDGSMDVCDVVIAGGDRGPKRDRVALEYRRREARDEEKMFENVCV